MLKIHTSIAVLVLLLINSPIILARHTTDTQQQPETSDQVGSQPSIADDVGNKGTFYDGQLDLGYGLDIIRQNNFDSVDWGQGFFIGKEFYHTDSWSVGIQGHFLSGSNNVNYYDDLMFNGYAIYATARPRALPILQLKAGLVDARYENINDRDSGSGLAYGMAIVTGNKRIRLHWLDYEIYQIGDDRFRSGSLGIVLILCIFGACA